MHAAAEKGIIDEVSAWQPAAYDSFLSNYWQKRPLLVRNACPNVTNLFGLDRQDYFALAQDDDVDSRVIQRSCKGRKVKWNKTYGPFEQNYLESLPSANWTLLVQEVDRHIPRVAALWDRLLPFVPTWRRDDIMISYSPVGGSIGPHVDNYDVFLLQGAGRRRWAVEQGPITADEEQRREMPNSPTKLLRDFYPHQQWELQEGDMLYLPPRLAHEGVTVGPAEGVTLSFGLRAAAWPSLLASMTEQLNRKPQSFYEGGVHILGGGSLLSDDVVKEVQCGLTDRIEAFAKSDLLTDWFGRFVTAPLRYHQRKPAPFFLRGLGDSEQADTDRRAVEVPEEPSDIDSESDEEDDREQLSGDIWPLRTKHRLASSRMFADPQALLEVLLDQKETIGLRRAEGQRVARNGELAFIDGGAYLLMGSDVLSAEDLGAALLNSCEVDVDTLQIHWTTMPSHQRRHTAHLLRHWLRRGLFYPVPRNLSSK